MSGATHPTSKKRSPPRRPQSAANYYRAIRRKFETLRIEAGETPTPFRTLTMATHAPRKTIQARVVRESDWNLIMSVICVAWSASPEADSGRELLISDAVQKLNDHLERRRDKS